jgi:hypothetical protein
MTAVIEHSATQHEKNKLGNYSIRWKSYRNKRRAKNIPKVINGNEGNR